MENKTNHKSEEIPEHKIQEIQLEIINLFRERKYSNVLDIMQQYQGQIEFASEIKQIGEKASEFATAHTFVKKCLDDCELYIQRGDIDNAEKMCAKIRSIDPNHPELKVFENQIQKIIIAERDTDAGIEQNPEQLLETSLIHFYKGDWQQAKTGLEKLLSINSDHVKARNLLNKCNMHIDHHSKVETQQVTDRMDSKNNKTIPDERDEPIDEIIQPIVEEFIEEESRDNLKENNGTSTKDKVKNNTSPSTFQNNTAGGVKSLQDSFDFQQLELGKKPRPTNSKQDEPITINILLYCLVFIVIFVVIMIGYQYYRKNIYLDNATKGQIEYFLLQAKQEIEAKNFLSARDFYNKVLDLYPRHKKAKRLLEELVLIEQKHIEYMKGLAKDYLREAENYLNHNNLSEAQRYAALAKETDPQNTDIIKLQARIDEAIKIAETKQKKHDEELQKKINNLLIEADYYIKDDDYQKAKAKCIQIINLQSDNVLAIELMKEINRKIREQEPDETID